MPKRRISQEQAKRKNALKQIKEILSVNSWHKVKDTVNLSVTADQLKRMAGPGANVTLEVMRGVERYCHENRIDIETLGLSEADIASSSLEDADAEEGDFALTGFISTLNIKDKDKTDFITKFNGRYLYIILDEDDQAVVYNCLLGCKTTPGLDLPGYVVWRRRSTGELRRISGNYLSNGHYLFLLGSKMGYNDARLSSFRVQHIKENVMCGIVAGISFTDSPFASKCVLWRASDRATPLAGRYRVKEAEKVLPADIYNYLFNKEPRGIYFPAEGE